ncbi:glycosyl hydrolase family 18 protein [Alkaliphilus serpentinus]|uniref:glycosyl hydrolase family 18 protein n=1 Tax=Alkaliphilus serpentinus TaxID=1482731 RepID=UPI001865777D|nr:glycosyl hydrolase family 18 protein [Alkaliphilus serpentinus]
MKKLFVFVTIVLILIIGTLLSFTYIVEGRYYPSLNQYGNILLEDVQINATALIEGEEIYIPYRVLKEYINPNAVVNLEEKRLFIDLSQNAYRFDNKETDSFVKANEFDLNFILKEVDGELYAPVGLLSPFLGIKVEYVAETEVVIIDFLTKDHLRAVAKRKGNIIERPKIISRRVAPLSAAEEITIMAESGDYYYVRNHQGMLGYTRKSNIQILSHDETPQIHYNFYGREPWRPLGKIGLVWDYVYHNTKDRREEDKLEAIDVLSPTWFSLSNSDGTIINKGDYSYVLDAHGKGYRVWGLVTNSFDPDLTSDFLSSKDSQDHFIRQILFYSSLYNLDGINIDFENIHYRDKDAFTNFVRSLTQHLKRENLVVSIDVTIPSGSPNWSKVYDRAKLGQIVDYVAVMTYDEHWATSPKSGSVASIGWVERGIKATLELVPPEKVLLGLPFYTRLWMEEEQNGKVKVSSKAYGMDKINEILLENNAEKLWNEESGQYYAEYEKDGKTYRVWLEDERSLALKTTLVEKYNLAGIAAWRKDFEYEGVWPVLTDMIKGSKTYDEVLLNLRK